MVTALKLFILLLGRHFLIQIFLPVKHVALNDISNKIKQHHICYLDLIYAQICVFLGYIYCHNVSAHPFFKSENIQSTLTGASEDDLCPVRQMTGGSTAVLS